MISSCVCHRLGRVEYRDGLELQRQLQRARQAQLVPDTLLLLEHSPVLTLGRGAHLTNIVAPPAQLQALGVETFETDRGGDVTYHGPGQLVGYPLLFLPQGAQDVRRYVRALEEVLIRTVADFQVAATRIPAWPGVWIEHSRKGGPKKIAALGVHLSRWYTKHGFAFNVNPDLSHFELIVPCGIKEAGVTSLAEERGGQAPDWAEVELRVAHHFGQVFEAQLSFAPSPQQLAAVFLVREQQVALVESKSDGGWEPFSAHVGEVGPAESASLEVKRLTGRALHLSDLRCPRTLAVGDHPVPELVTERSFTAELSANDAISGAQTAFFSLEEAVQRAPNHARAVRLSLAARASASLGR